MHQYLGLFLMYLYCIHFMYYRYYPPPQIHVVEISHVMYYDNLYSMIIVHYMADFHHFICEHLDRYLGCWSYSHAHVTLPTPSHTAPTPKHLPATAAYVLFLEIV